MWVAALAMSCALPAGVAGQGSYPAKPVTIVVPASPGGVTDMLGRTLVQRAEGRATEPFAFRDAGYIISLGKHSSVLDLFGIPLSGKLAWLMWAGAYLVKMVGFRKQLEVGIDHLTHLMFEHDTSQILNRRAVLTDDELNLALGEEDASTPTGATRT